LYFTELSGWFIYCSIIKVHCIALFSAATLIEYHRLPSLSTHFFKKFLHFSTAIFRERNFSIALLLSIVNMYC